MSGLVKIEIGTQADRVAVLTLTDPKRRNAITPAMNAELVSAFSALEADPSVGAVVITGDGSSFCAGADLQHLGASPTEEGLRGIYEGFLRVAASPLPTLAAVNGPAVGAGMNMALCCDVRIAGPSARFDTRFLQLAVHPGGGHSWMMQRTVGTQATLAAVLFGETLDGVEAQRCGLVWKCVTNGDLLGAAVAMAERVASVPPELARRTKATVARMTSVETHEEAVTEELRVQRWSMEQPEFTHRLNAWQQKISKSR